MKLQQAETSVLNKHIRTLSGNDTMMKGSFQEILIAGNVLVVDNDLWRSWTGIRFLNGEEYHGPVYVMGTQKLYEGIRTCICKTCQPQKEFRININ